MCVSVSFCLGSSSSAHLGCGEFQFAPVPRPQYIYSIIARVLTDWELHPTQTMYGKRSKSCVTATAGVTLTMCVRRTENSLIVKLTLFYVINSYFSLFYIAALKSQGVYIAGQQELCDPGPDGTPDCMSELQLQLASLMLTRFVSAHRRMGAV